MKKRTAALLTAGSATAGILLAALDVRLAVRHYTVESEKVDGPIRLAVLTDLHACRYGKNQEQLVAAVAAQKPDLVVMCGDIVDDEPRMEEWRALLTVKKLADRWPVYYASGNHEHRTGRLAVVKELRTACGAVVRDGKCVCAAAGAQMVQIGGIDDPETGEENWQDQLTAASGDLEGSHFSILLTHRPGRGSDYAGSGFELGLAGPGHPGAVGQGGLINGVLAPNQGLFPSYAGGRYEIGGATLIVSRGLARESTRVPRLFNRPELVVVDIEPPK